MIGSLGLVVFETSSNRIRTFNNFKRSGNARWATHEIMGKKPVQEFLGPGLEQISLTIKLDVAMGVNPYDSLILLRWFRDNGIAMPFILNGRPISDNLWVIDSMSESWEKIDNRGRLIIAEVELTLIEYLGRGVNGV